MISERLFFLKEGFPSAYESVISTRRAKVWYLQCLCPLATLAPRSDPIFSLIYQRKSRRPPPATASRPRTWKSPAASSAILQRISFLEAGTRVLSFVSQSPLAESWRERKPFGTATVASKG